MVYWYNKCSTVNTFSPNNLAIALCCTGTEREGLLVIGSWLRALHINPDSPVWYPKYSGTLKIFFGCQISRSICWSGGLMLIDESELCSWSTALRDTIIDCQDLYAELKINHLVTGRTLPTDNNYQVCHFKSWTVPLLFHMATFTVTLLRVYS